MLRKTTANPASLEVTSKDNPPASLERYAPTIQPPQQSDYLNAIAYALKCFGIAKTETEISQHYQDLFGDTRQTLTQIKTAAISDKKSQICSFLSEQQGVTFSSSRLTEYHASCCTHLENLTAQQELGIDRSIESELRAMAQDDAFTFTPHAIEDYVKLRYTTIHLYQSIASLLYNVATEYYSARWQESHHDSKLLQKECDAINYIFADIVQINPDFTITPPLEILQRLTKKNVHDIQDFLNQILKRAAANKFDHQKKNYGQLVNLLNTFTIRDDKPQGEYFAPLNLQDKKPHLAFHDSIKEEFSRYTTARSAIEHLSHDVFDQITSTQRQARERIHELSTTVSGMLEADLASVQYNLARHAEILQDEEKLLSHAGKCSKLIEPAHLRLRAIVPPINLIRGMKLPKRMNDAWLDAFEKGDIGTQRDALLQRAKHIEGCIDAQQRTLAKRMSDVQESAQTLKRIELHDEMQSLEREYVHIEEEITQLGHDITELESLLKSATIFTAQAAQVKTDADNAMDYYQALLDGNREINFFADAVGKQYPFTTALQKLNNLRKQPYYSHLPEVLSRYFDDTVLTLTTASHDFSVILRCHEIFHAVLNLHYWSLNKKESITILTANGKYRIPQAIYTLIEIANRPEHVNWATDPQAATHLLTTIQEFAGRAQSNSNAVRNLLQAVAAPDQAVVLQQPLRIFSKKPSPTPPQLINPEELKEIRKQPPFWERHPLAKKILLGAGITLFTLGLLTACVGLIMATGGVAAAFIAGAAATASAAIGGTAVFGGLLGLGAAIITGIGAGIGALVYKIQEKRQQRKLAASNNPFALSASTRIRPPAPRAKPRVIAAPVADNNPFVTDGLRAAPSQLRASASPATLYQTPHAQQREFANAVFIEIVNTYAGKPGEAHSSPLLRDDLTLLWDKCNRSLDLYMQALLESKPMTARSVITKAIEEGSKQFPGVLEKYPARSFIKEFLTERKAQVDRARSLTGSRNNNI